MSTSRTTEGLLASTSDPEQVLTELEQGEQQNGDETLEVGSIGFIDIFKRFIYMGWIAFGGPAAHIGLFQKTFVDQLKWISDSVFVELLALCQCLPGPTSTQMSFTLGIVQKGVPGGLMSGMLFQYPGLLIMSLVGIGAANFLKQDEMDARLKALVDGLSAVGVALVASAAKKLFSKICTSSVLQIICTVCTIIPFYKTTNWNLPLLLAMGGVTSYIVYRKNPDSVKLKEADAKIASLGLSMVGGGILIAMWLAILVATIVLTNVKPYAGYEPLFWFEAFYRTGSLIFGGGQVVLPMLLDQLVVTDCSQRLPGQSECPVVQSESWLSRDQFFAGLGVVQALPGPLFNFSAYLGAVIAIEAGKRASVGIAVCWLGLFAPGLMLIYGILPFWGRFRHLLVYRQVLPGLNSAAVGFIIAAVFSMMSAVVDNALHPTSATAIGIIAFAAVEQGVQAPVAVLMSGGLGVLCELLNLN